MEVDKMMLVWGWTLALCVRIVMRMLVEYRTACSFRMTPNVAVLTLKGHACHLSVLKNRRVNCWFAGENLTRENLT